MKVIIINGPNLNLLGVREPSIYGNEGFETYFKQLQSIFSHVVLEYYQSNHEGNLIDKLHEIGFSYDGIVLNAGAYTHTSIAVSDAISAIKTPVIEVHISNIHSREEFRHKSYLTKNCVGIISGLGLKGYELAVNYLISK